MKEKFYYLREEKSGKAKTGEVIISEHKKGVVFLVIDEHGNIGKGISSCNPKDDFHKVTFGSCKSMPEIIAGKQSVSLPEQYYFKRCKSNGEEPVIGGLNRARGRALRALRRKTSTSVIGREEIKDMFKEDYKSIFNPTLNPLEERMLYRK